MDDINKDCVYWQEDKANCKILTYKECPTNCKWKQTSGERKAKKEKARQRIAKMQYSTHEAERLTWLRIVNRYFGARSSLKLDNKEK